MDSQLIKAMQPNQLVYMMYISTSGIITKKRISKQAKCAFIIDNILVIPVVYKERGIV